MFDGVDTVHLTALTHHFNHIQELNEFGGGNAIILVPKDLFKDNGPVTVGIIEFDKRDERRKVLFTNIAYVCDDRGNTIDKLSVKHGKERT